MGYLYKLDFASGKSYVGITYQKRLELRIRTHRCCAASGDKLPVYRAWRKHGEPIVTVLAIAGGDHLLLLEKRAVEVYGTFGKGGYNASPGGDLVPVMTPEIRAKIAAAAVGRVYSVETRAKMSARGKGRPKSAETRAKIAEWHRGRKYSAEVKLKMSIAKLALNLKHTPEAKAKMSEAHAGVPKSAEHKRNIAIAKTGQTLSAETKAKIAEARTGKTFPALSVSKWRNQWHSMAWACGVRVDRQRQLDLDGGAA